MEIGGYFELELRRGTAYHTGALELNCGRNAFQYILNAKKYKKVYLPYYTCSSLLEPVQKMGLETEFYHINEKFEPDFNFKKVRPEEVFVYTNYFGLCDQAVSKVAGGIVNLIIDNAQAFYSIPLKGVDTFYSPRKFFGVPDGSYLYLNTQMSCLDEELPVFESAERIEHLLIRIEKGAESGFDAFRRNEKRFHESSISKMSLLSKRLLASIDYKFVARQRRSNFLFLHKRLKTKNQLNLNLSENSVPMAYPFLVDGSEIRTKLIEEKIYIPIYWPNVLEWCDSNSFEYKLTKNTLPLPIDQRYGPDEMNMIVKNLTCYL